jgi:hypothetical protein
MSGIPPVELPDLVPAVLLANKALRELQQPIRVTMSDFFHVLRAYG